MSKKHYYRNWTEVLGQEPDSLWVLEDGFYVLVDDDQLVKADISHVSDFYPVPNPLPEMQKS